MRWCIYINVYNCGDYCDVSFCIWVYMLYINIGGIDSLFIEFVKV